MALQRNGKLNVSSFCDDVLGDRDGVAISDLVKNKEISPGEAIDAAISRSLKVNPEVNAVAFETFNDARKKSLGEVSGPFAGVPIFTKDNECIAGVPIGFGSSAMPLTVASGSGDIACLNERLGFVSLGKSTLPEFGLTATTETLRYGVTRNPWNPLYSTGGSSGGAAALVSAGVVPIAHANDGGGSIRIPASCCGLVGLKPSRDRLGVARSSKMIPIKLFTQGMVSRSVRDTSLYYGYAERAYKNPNLPGIGMIDRPNEKRLRIGFFSSLSSNMQCDTQVEAAVNQVATLCEQLGHHVENIVSPFKASVFDDFAVYWAMLAFYTKYFSKTFVGVKLNRSELEPFTHSLCRHFLKNSPRLPAIVNRLKTFSFIYERAFLKYDVLLTPTMVAKPPEIGYLSPDKELDVLYERLKHLVPFSCFQNLSGAPAISLPLGFCKNRNLPIGVQFAAPYGLDGRLLELALELEEASPW